VSAGRWLLGGVVVLVLAVVVLGRWLHGDPGSVSVTGAAAAPVLAASRLPVLPAAGVVLPPPPPAHDTPLLPLPSVSVDAAQSMSAAREHGDPRAPAVVRSPAREMPTAAELADPEAYQHYEERQNQRLYNAYVKAADAAVPQLQQDIDRARREGLPEEEIRKGEEKLRRIQAMRDQLSADHPEAAAPAP
jgi:hypothetical protein